MTLVTLVLLVMSAFAGSWLCARMRWRNRVTDLESEWADREDQLLGELRYLREEVLRARSRAAQLTRATAAWADGYARGRNDMIRAAAALQGKLPLTDDPAEQPPLSA
jgi:hypothetical protein